MQQPIEKKIKINWCPGSQSATFQFISNAQARAFIETFCEATRLLFVDSQRKIHEGNPIGIVEVPNLKRDKNVCPENNMKGLVSIRNMESYFENDHGKELNLDVSPRGNNFLCFMETLIDSILYYGPTITPQQFCIKSYHNDLSDLSLGGIDDKQFQTILRVIRHRNMHPLLQLNVQMNTEDLTDWFKPRQVESINQAFNDGIKIIPGGNDPGFFAPNNNTEPSVLTVDAPAHNALPIVENPRLVESINQAFNDGIKIIPGGNDPGFFAPNNNNAEPSVLTVDAPAHNALPIVENPRLSDVKSRIISNTFVELVNLVNTTDNVEALLKLQANLQHSIAIFRATINAENVDTGLVPMELDAEYDNPPRPGN